MSNHTKYVNDEFFGERYVGTRDDFRAALAGNWPEWHREAETESSLDEFIEASLDAHLSTADDEDPDLPTL